MAKTRVGGRGAAQQAPLDPPERAEEFGPSGCGKPKFSPGAAAGSSLAQFLSSRQSLLALSAREGLVGR